MTNDDVDALVWACVEDGMQFGQITKELRAELRCGIEDAIIDVGAALDRLTKGGNAKADDVLVDWIVRHKETALRLGLITKWEPAR